MVKSYKTILKYGVNEIIIKKSKFLGYAKPIKNEEEALDFVNEIKKLHRDATHNVHAYITGNNSMIQRFNDDGEPQGTAGIPILEIIKKEELTDIVIVVTRYFGGIKLGAGGLIRAYAQGAKIAIDAARIVEMQWINQIKLELDYTLYGKVDNYLKNEEIDVISAEFLDKVFIKININESSYEFLESKLLDLTGANINLEVYNSLYLPVSDNKIITI